MSIVGKKITKVEMNADNYEMRLTDTEGTAHWLAAVGDCCSKSWFEHVNLPSLPFVVKEELTVPYDAYEVTTYKDPEGEYSDNDEMKIYALKFKTSTGTLDIELRNASNGYYGGEIAYSTDNPVDQYRRTRTAGKMRDISKDGL